eukprot:TRINITY_DN1804_c0_g1_i1.p1 TRINITY_DN1804_c0_g1~~TRINITY_DN1804_c0_g1_i1.p1  ORF type:complete len:440 (+),score=75.47 TRINITY_DN1804_c0_g1_i1:805-2124(+)
MRLLGRLSFPLSTMQEGPDSLISPPHLSGGPTPLPRASTRRVDIWRHLPIFRILAVALIAWLVKDGSLSMWRTWKFPVIDVIQRMEDLSRTCQPTKSPGLPVSSPSAALLDALGRPAGPAEYVLHPGDFRAPSNLCNLTDAAIENMLALQHDCSRTLRRVFLKGQWMTMWEARELLFNPLVKGTSEDKEVECAVVCADHTGPCFDDKCLIPLHLRRNTTDTMVAAQLLDLGEYDVVKPGMPFTTILDGGANCGIATVIFATMFPEATIVSVEPSTSNFLALQRNTAAYRNVIPIHAGLWPRVAPLVLTNGGRTPSEREWGFMVQEDSVSLDRGTVLDTLQGVSVEFLYQVLGLPGFDLLKIDIEGSEKELMGKAPNNPLEWLDGAKMAMLEVHQDMREGSKEAVAMAFAERPSWRWVQQWGEYHIYTKGDWEVDFFVNA